jgi:hypothetical protein
VKVETPPPQPSEEKKPELSKTEPVAPPVVPTKPVPPKTEPGAPPEIAVPVASIELLQKASEAKWTNGSQDLAFFGEASSRKGFVRYVENAQLENYIVAHKALETCPQLQPGGFIEGRIANVTIPESGAEFHASIGFLKGSKDTEGVFFEVRGEFPDYRGIPIRREYFKPYNESLVNDFVQDLSRFKGLKGTIVLSVTAGLESSEQNWAIWVEPRVVPLEKAGKGPVFVGGAVGSGQDGNKLLNAWGGKAGTLYSDVAVYLLFANVDKAYTVRLDSYRNGMFVGSTDFGNIKKDQTEIWQTLYRTMQGEWRERVMLNGAYAGDLRYTVSKSAE